MKKYYTVLVPWHNKINMIGGLTEGLATKQKIYKSQDFKIFSRFQIF